MEKPANPAMAAAANVARISLGTRSRCGLSGGRPRGRTVSGRASTTAAATATSTRSTTNTSFSGAGAYCASTPASNGPTPRPPRLAPVARRVAARRRRSGASSITITVAVPVARPADSPDRVRPVNSSGSPPARRKHTALRPDNASAASRTGRRPMKSDTCPSSSSATMTPAAYTAKITVTMNEEKPNSRW